MKETIADQLTRKIILKLRDIRVEKGLSMTEVASRAGLDQVAVSRLEKGERSPMLRTAISIANALEVSFSDIIKELE